MDMIYANTNKQDIGVIDDFKLDLAYGADENNFQLEMALNRHCCEEGYFVYIESENAGMVEGSEYGGVVDEIEVDTEQNKVIYTGRTWHGIMAETIIVPSKGQDYFQINGECNAAIRALINHVNLGDLFEVSEDDSGIVIYDISKFRYSNLYDSIRNMLFGAGAKLKIEYKKGKLLLSAVPYVDYSQSGEWDSSQIGFKIKKNFKPINHIICLGNGELKDRHVIHLFADEYGEIQPYKLTENPVKDADYILDTSNQKMFGIDERTTVLDYSSATDKINYVALTEKPSDWDANYEQYYEMSVDAEGERNYMQLASSATTTYNPLKSKPSDWDVNYASYYEVANNTYTHAIGEFWSDMQVVGSKPTDWNTTFMNYYWYTGTYYKSVESEVVETYTQLSEYPDDWEDSFGNYYKYVGASGTGADVYEKWTGEEHEKYVLLTSMPYDWASNYKNYYYKDGSKYVALTSQATFKTNKYYKKETYTTAPIFEIDVTTGKPNVWVRSTKEVLPDFYAQTVYQECGTYDVPTWETGKYYTASVNKIAIEWKPGMYYKQYVDHYASLIESGLARFEEYKNCNSIETNLDATNVYDIGDVVGATEQVTGMAVWQPVSKKIVTIQNNHETIAYKIG